MLDGMGYLFIGRGNIIDHLNDAAQRVSATQNTNRRLILPAGCKSFIIYCHLLNDNNN